MRKSIQKIVTLGGLLAVGLVFGQEYSLYGTVTNEANQPVDDVKISIKETGTAVWTNEEGYYKFPALEKGTYTLNISFPNGKSVIEYVKVKDEDVRFNFAKVDTQNIKGVEVFGARNASQRKIEQITRFPVSIKDQIQSISVVSSKLIEEQGALTITSALQNIPGVTQFASYGKNTESMSIRGFRGTPVLKNGVRMDSDFRTAGAITDMAGVESIQVIRGSAALTQGIGNDLGSPGGVINVVTKTPRFINAAEVGVRSGSWWRTRLFYDGQTVLGAKDNVGLRLAGAFQVGNSSKNSVKNDRVYVAPSFAWKIDSKTKLVLEMDYLKDNATPDRGTINLGPDTEEALYDMGRKFTGFGDDLVEIENLTYSGTLTRQIADKVSARVGYYNSYYTSDQTGASLSLFKDSQGDIIYNKRNRGIGRSYRDDRNTTIQVDVMGKDMKIGFIDWSWQVGYDYTMSRVSTSRAKGIRNIDVIDVYQDINNADVTSFANFNPASLELGEATLTRNHYYGFVTQHHIGITDYFKLVGGARWSYSIEKSESVVDPFAGIIISPTKNINLFGSYTTNSSLRSANNPTEDGGTVGVQRTKQLEFGVKTNWFNDRFRANVVYYDMKNENLAYRLYDNNQTPTGFYGLAGDLKRRGVEVEVAGRPIPNLQVMLGYAYLDAFYQDSPSYVDGSSPMNAPENTANAWLQYSFTQNFLKNFSIAAGVYYVGQRPVNNYTKVTTAHDTTPGTKYFDMPSYTTLNVQMGYQTGKFDIRLFFNNLTDAIGYNAYYRGGYINRIDPFNVSAQVSYRF